MIKFNDYKNFLLKNKILLKSQQRFISKKHDLYTEDINKIALCCVGVLLVLVVGVDGIVAAVVVIFVAFLLLLHLCFVLFNTYSVS